MIYYSPTIIKKIGFFSNLKNSASLILFVTILLYLLNSIGMFIAYLLVDKVGRRGLLLWSQPITSLSLIIMGIGFYFTNFNDKAIGQWILGISLVKKNY